MLALVVLMLFAISVAGAAGYLVVNTEFTMARYANQGEEALAVARAGLQRFVAEQVGAVGDSAAYAIGDGVARIRARKLAATGTFTDLYYLRSEASVSDPRTPAAPARRVVGAYAELQRRPLRHHAAFVVSASTLEVRGRIDGDDQATPFDCAGGGSTEITGGIATSAVVESGAGDVDGMPSTEIWSGGFAEVYDEVALRWDVLTDPGFPVDFDGVVPDYGALPADSFPLVRVNGSLNAGPSWSGRGVLIVTGSFDAGPGFSWDGIVLTGSVAGNLEGTLRGLFVGGLGGTNPASTVVWRGDARYDSCKAYAANETLAYLELLDGTMFEAN